MEFLLQLAMPFAMAAGVYAAIKSDLTRAIITAERAEKDAGEAHHRLNRHIDIYHRQKEDHV